jgi:RNAse (barnase) inhibitor barstar
LQNITDSFSNRFDQFKSTNHKAFQEILVYLDRITKEFTHQDQFKAETEAIKAKLQGEIDAQLAIQLSDLDARKNQNSGMQEDQYRKLLQLMLELEKKIESKNIEVRADFTRELQKVHKTPKPEFDSDKLSGEVQQQINNLEAHFKSQFMRRVEIVEEAIDGTVARIDKFLAQNQNDLAKQEKLE